MSSPVLSADYDPMARYYHAVTRVISAGGNRRAQRRLLAWVRPTDRVLHVGCGSVGFNEDVARAARLTTSVDISPRMIQLARQRVERTGLGDRVRFICVDVMSFEAPESLDVVIAGFFLNTFLWEDCVRVLEHLARQVRPGGLLCIADEAVPRSRALAVLQRPLRRLVTWGHHAVVGHPLHEVYDYEPVVTALGFELLERTRDRSGYIESSVYRCRR